MDHRTKRKLRGTSYPFALSLKLAARMWRINGIVFVSFFLAMTVIVCCTALINNWVETRRSHYAVSQLEQLSLCNFTDTPLRPQEIDGLRSELRAEAIAADSQVEAIETPEAGELEVKALCGEVTQIFQVEISQGRFFTPEELHTAPAVCVVGQVTAKKKGIRAGDLITLRDIPCRVIGIASLDANQLDVLVPMETYFSDRPNILQQQSVYCVTNTPLQSADCEIAFLKAGREAQIHLVRTAEQEQAQRLRHTNDSIRVYAIAAVVAFLFAVTNIFLILKGKFDTKQYLYAIQRALGAKNSQIFAQILAENLGMACLASGAALLVLPAALDLLGFGAFYYCSSVVAATAAAISGATCAAASLLLFWSAIRLPIVEVLQREAGKV